MRNGNRSRSRKRESSNGKAGMTPVKGKREGQLGRKSLRQQYSSERCPSQAPGESPSKDVHWKNPISLKNNLALVFLT